jgi:hypothetical protein
MTYLRFQWFLQWTTVVAVVVEDDDSILKSEGERKRGYLQSKWGDLGIDWVFTMAESSLLISVVASVRGWSWEKRREGRMLKKDVK